MLKYHPSDDGSIIDGRVVVFLGRPDEHQLPEGAFHLFQNRNGTLEHRLLAC